ncbi:hypothetical protein A2392_01030 [Candidatus Kaiserbacteria bacterium RIFOXYB1_FULL_46_14]|uniref:Cell shape-determining protein MreC n=1 Tax=Candidatus Kaiserbacteria bacterium RIFOXYB1_FULL_46_14 TaxID=1798531 RepID=A0A1F6FJK2_9BACT|nr:MAG: hypothetical protein A2392_01030 [Candidatus Kaiserbacteria bacterium RIFOXYB1_FULL_46_14]
MKRFLSTKTTNRHRTSPEKHELVLLGSIFLPLFLLLWLFPGLLGQIAAPIIKPFLSAETKLRQSLSNQDQTDVNLETVELERLKAENTELRTLLGGESEARIAAGVIGRPTNLPYDVLVIDKGERDGIVKDAPVYVNDNQAIGFVVAVYGESSVVALVTTPGWRSTVYIYGPNIYTTAVGQGGGIARVHTPQGIKLEEGNIVVVPSLSAGIYGRISAIDSIPSRTEQYGYVAMNMSLNSLHLVSVGTRPLSTIDFETAKTVVNEAARALLEVSVPEGILIEAESASSTATSTTAATTTEVQ